tara:strand:+ start:4201 stop:4665 length:465 start_codon:yes stop_codon:yes gene_type:complete
MAIIGIADTCFAKVNMAEFAISIINSNQDHKVVRYTVPGLKDLPVACKKLFIEDNCEIVLALGMAGPMPIDKQCSHQASTSIQNVMLQVNKHILEIFVHMDEAKTDQELYDIAKNRTEKHTHNALALLKGKTTLTPQAGTGKRQGKDDVGPVKL